MKPTKTIIMGAAGRDFHNFNVFFRDNEQYRVVAFTATQIPNINDRRYPASLAGSLYPEGISIFPEEQLADLIKKHQIEKVIFSYSDVSYQYLMNRAALVNQLGADFVLLGTNHTMIKAAKPVIAVCAVRTGCGKSQLARKIVRYLKEKQVKAAAIRHPMPYGNLAQQAVQRFAVYEDFAKHDCTIEEREEYEPYVEQGLTVFAGVDYGQILEKAEKEADLILWDGGNNDTPFYHPDLLFTIVDPHRAGHEIGYYPGETNFRLADVLVINKIKSAPQSGVEQILENIKKYNPEATIAKTASVIHTQEAERIAGKRVLVIEDGPTVTHGEMAFGAGYLAAQKNEAEEIVDPRPAAVGALKETFAKYTHLKNVLPAMGYGESQVKDLEETINRTDCDLVLSGTPINLASLIKINKPLLRVTYDLEEVEGNQISEAIDIFVKKQLE
ncbi:MAG: GTPase [Candidatus Pacebacteria bacterium]|nr:GTPase [Candidatus Paceibacterota bacterium]